MAVTLLLVLILIGVLSVIRQLTAQRQQNRTIIDQNEVLIETLDKMNEPGSKN